MYQDQWFHAKLAEHRATTPHSGETSYCCRALVEWREMDERGNPTPGHEKCYCPCGNRQVGRLSPWYDKAYADWMNTPYMIRSKRRWHLSRVYGRIKHRSGIPARHKLTDTQHAI